MAPLLFIVVPCYNEESALPETLPVFSGIIQNLKDQALVSAKSKILFVDDGSKDATWKIIENASTGEFSTNVMGLKLAHNKGHQNALLAGLFEAYDMQADCTVSIDADLQDDPAVIEEMVRRYRDGVEIVYGARNNRDTDSSFKRNTARGFYKTMHALGVETIPDSADFRLIGRNALAALKEHTESNLFLRGIVPSLGFTSEVVYYKRAKRVAGESKYPLKKMISFALDGITSFSVRPIRSVFVLGAIAVVMAIAIMLYSFIQALQGQVVPGWTTIMLSIWLVGGMLMISTGIIGEYIGRIYMETKQRPRFIIEKKAGNPDSES